MQLPMLLSAAALAWSATASAFLLPPDTKDIDIQAWNPLPSSSGQWTAHLNCAGCPVAQDREGDEPRGFVQAAELNSELVLDFATSERNEITVSGVPIYPPQAGAPPFTAKQMLKTGGDGMVQATSDDLMVSTRMDFGQETPAGDGAVVPFKMEVLGVEGAVVHVDTVSFDILRSSEGKLSIYEPMTIASNNTPLDTACATVLCRVKAQLLAKMAAVKAKMGAFAKGCMRKMGFRPHGAHKHGHAHPHTQIEDKLNGGPKKYAGKFGKKPCPGKAGHHHGTAARIAHAMISAINHVLIPVFIGIGAGMAVSALGLLIGQTSYLIWLRFFRKESVVLYQIIETSDEEAALDAEDDEPLPKYEEKEALLPEYSEEKSVI